MPTSAARRSLSRIPATLTHFLRGSPRNNGGYRDARCTSQPVRWDDCSDQLEGNTQILGQHYETHLVSQRGQLKRNIKDEPFSPSYPKIRVDESNFSFDFLPHSFARIRRGECVSRNLRGYEIVALSAALCKNLLASEEIP